MEFKTRLISFIAVLTIATGIFVNLSTVKDVKGEVVNKIQMPKTVKANTITYTIENKPDVFFQEDVIVWGLTTFDKSLIEIDSDIKLDRQQQVLLHEYFHALLYETNGNQFVTDEEKFCSWISKALIPALRDNPEMVEFLIQK